MPNNGLIGLMLMNFFVLILFVLFLFLFLFFVFLFCFVFVFFCFVLFFRDTAHTTAMSLCYKKLFFSQLALFGRHNIVAKNISSKTCLFALKQFREHTKN